MLVLERNTFSVMSLAIAARSLRIRCSVSASVYRSSSSTSAWEGFLNTMLSTPRLRCSTSISISLGVSMAAVPMHTAIFSASWDRMASDPMTLRSRGTCDRCIASSVPPSSVVVTQNRKAVEM